MARLRITVVSLILAAVVAGCATPVTQRVKVDDALVALEAKKQRQIALETRMASLARLQRVAYPLLEAGTDFCGERTRPAIGAFFANKYLFDNEYRDIAIEWLRVGEALQVIQVIDGSPAAEAGLQQGDVVVSVGGVSAPVGEGAAEEMHELLKSDIKPSEPVEVTISRGGTVQSLTVTARQICDYPVQLVESDDVNAYANGKSVIIAYGMERFATNDRELALVIGHELAHNAMGHIDKKMQNYVVGSIFDILAAVYGVDTQGTFGKIAAQAYSKDFEAEADYVGMFILARSGQPLEGAPNFWRRMAATHPASIRSNHAATHPATPERFLALEKTIEEIRGKIASGAPLDPEYKKPTTEDSEKDEKKANEEEL